MYRHVKTRAEMTVSMIEADKMREEYFKKKTEKREEQRKNNKVILDLFCMFYKNIERVELEPLFTIPRENRGAVLELARQLEFRGINPEKWIETSKKVFGVSI